MRGYVASLLDYMRFGRTAIVDEESQWYLHSVGRMLTLLEAWGLIAVADNGALRFTDDTAAFARARRTAAKDFAALRKGTALAAYMTEGFSTNFKALQSHVRAAEDAATATIK